MLEQELILNVKNDINLHIMNTILDRFEERCKGSEDPPTKKDTKKEDADT
jgi:hypothetical protein